MAPQQVNLPEQELDWISVRQDTAIPETSKEKLIRKVKQNPFVPIGCVVTAGVLGIGLYNFRTGNRKMSQMMMRARILAQGLTVAALIAGVLIAYKKD